MAKLKVWLTAETKQFQRSLRKADQAVAQWSAKAKRYALVGGAALAAAGVQSVRAFAKQEAAENSLASALSSNGDAVNSLMPKYRQLASEIQSQTTYGDEFALSLMAQIRNLGVLPGELGKTTKGAIGLAKALNLDANSAARYAALAAKGEYTVLQRYVPALRTATTEQEKAAVVADLMAKGYSQAQAETDTAAGRFKQLKNALGDVQEGFGAVIVELFNGGQGMKTFTQRAAAFAAKMRQDAPQIAFVIKSMWTEGKFALKQTWNALDVLGFNMLALFSNLKNNFGTLIGWFADNWFKLFKNLPRIASNAFKLIEAQIAELRGDISGSVEGQISQSLTDVHAGRKTLDEHRKLVSRLRNEGKGIFAGTDLVGPELKNLTAFRSMTKEIGQIERDKQTELARHQAALDQKLVQAKAAGTQTAMAQAEAAAGQQAGRGRSEIFSDQFLKIGGMLGNVNRAASPEREMRKQTSIQERIAEGIQRLRDAMTAAKPRFV